MDNEKLRRIEGRIEDIKRKAHLPPTPAIKSVRVPEHRRFEPIETWWALLCISLICAALIYILVVVSIIF